MGRPGLREELVASALDAIHRRGYASCGVQEITDGAGAPKGSFYNHFASKEALAVEVLARYTAARAVAPLPQGADAREHLRAHYARLVGLAEDRGCRDGCLLGGLAAEASDEHPALRQAVREALDIRTDTVAAVLAAAVPPVVDPHDTAAAVVDAWQGAVLRSRVLRGPAPLRRFLEATLPRLVRP